MEYLDWGLVVFGVLVALGGGWIQVRPETIYPRQPDERRLDAASLVKMQRLGLCIHFMGAFFAIQMTADLASLPWWSGTVVGVAVALFSVRKTKQAALRRIGARRVVRQGPLPKKTVELRPLPAKRSRVHAGTR